MSFLHNMSATSSFISIAFDTPGNRHKTQQNRLQTNEWFPMVGWFHCKQWKKYIHDPTLCFTLNADRDYRKRCSKSIREELEGVQIKKESLDTNEKSITWIYEKIVKNRKKRNKKEMKSAFRPTDGK